MNTTKKLMTLLLAMLTANLAIAYDFEVDGIYYNLNEQDATVTVTNYSGGPTVIPGKEYSGDIVIPASITTDEGKTYTVVAIGPYAFTECTELTSLSIPSTVTEIGYKSFNECTALMSISIPNSVTLIGEYAFHESMLEEVVLPESLQSLGKGAFARCYYLKKVQIKANLEVIPEDIFRTCVRLEEITLPSTVRKIEKNAFLQCFHLTTMPMLDSLQIIEEGAFSSTGIEYLKTGKSITYIGDNAFAVCTEMKSAEIDDPVTTLGEWTFESAYSLQKVIVGNGVHKIPKYFCSHCHELTSVMLGNAVDTIDTQCFMWCEKLNTFICMAEVPPVTNGNEDEFFDSVVFQNATLYVPGSSIEAYKTAKVWKKFQNIVDVKNVIVPGDVNGDGEITIADANNVIDIVVMGGNSGHTRIPAADVNNDGEISIADFNAIIYMILNNH